MIIERIILPHGPMVDPSRVEVAKSVLTVVTKVALEIAHHQILTKPIIRQKEEVLQNCTNDS